MALEFNGTKKKFKEEKYSIITLDLFKPTSKKYPEFDYEEIRRQVNNGESSDGEDKAAMDLVRRLEEKYGGKKGKKKRNLSKYLDDFIDKSAGYDVDDDFIDDSEEFDERIPSTMDTVKGGFYVNRGKLEFVQTEEGLVFESDEEAENSETEKRKKAKESAPPVAREEPKTIQQQSRSLVSTDDSDDEPLGTVKKNAKDLSALPETGKEQQEKVQVPESSKEASTIKHSGENGSKGEVPRPRMVGGPPTKRHLAQSASQQLAKQIKKKRLEPGAPSLLAKKQKPVIVPRPKVDATAAGTATAVSNILAAAAMEAQSSSINMSPRPQTAANGVSSNVVQPAAPSVVPQKQPQPQGTHSEAKKAPPTMSAEVLKAVQDAVNAQLAAATMGVPVQSSTSINRSFSSKEEWRKDDSIRANVLEIVRPLEGKNYPGLSDTLAKLISEFKVDAERLAQPGQKKRLQKKQIRIVMEIENQTQKEQVPSRDRSRIMEGLAEFVGIQRQSLYLRVKQYREETAAANTATGIGADKSVLPSSANANGVSSATPQLSNTTTGSSTVSSAPLSKPTGNGGNNDSDIQVTKVVQHTPSKASASSTNSGTTSQQTAKPAVKNVDTNTAAARLSQLLPHLAVLQNANVPGDMLSTLIEKFTRGEVGIKEVNQVVAKFAPLSTTSTTQGQSAGQGPGKTVAQTQQGSTQKAQSSVSVAQGTSNSGALRTANQLPSAVAPKPAKRPAQRVTTNNGVPAAAVVVGSAVKASASASSTQQKAPTSVDFTGLDAMVKQLKNLIAIAVQNMETQYARDCANAIRQQVNPAVVKKKFHWTDQLKKFLRTILEAVSTVAAQKNNADEVCQVISALIQHNLLPAFKGAISQSQLEATCAEVFPGCPGLKKPNALKSLPVKKGKENRHGSQDDDIQVVHETQPSTSAAVASTSTTKANEQPTNVSATGSSGPENTMEKLAKLIGLRNSAELQQALSSPVTAGMVQMKLMSNPEAMKLMTMNMTGASPSVSSAPSLGPTAKPAAASSSSPSTQPPSQQKPSTQADVKSIPSFLSVQRNTAAAEAERKQRDEERKKAIEQKKQELKEAKERQKEEERKRKAEEKAKKEEEERQRRLKEEEEKERKRRELAEQKLKEEAEQRRIAEQHEKAMQRLRIKQDLERQREEEERKRKQLAEVQAERVRTEEQRKKVEAMRAAAVAAETEAVDVKPNLKKLPTPHASSHSAVDSVQQQNRQPQQNQPMHTNQYGQQMGGQQQQQQSMNFNQMMMGQQPLQSQQSIPNPQQQYVNPQQQGNQLTSTMRGPTTPGGHGSPHKQMGPPQSPANMPSASPALSSGGFQSPAQHFGSPYAHHGGPGSTGSNTGHGPGSVPVPSPIHAAYGHGSGPSPASSHGRGSVPIASPVNAAYGQATPSPGNVSHHGASPMQQQLHHQQRRPSFTTGAPIVAQSPSGHTAMHGSFPVQQSQPNMDAMQQHQLQKQQQMAAQQQMQQMQKQQRPVAAPQPQTTMHQNSAHIAPQQSASAHGQVATSANDQYRQQKLLLQQQNELIEQQQRQRQAMQAAQAQSQQQANGAQMQQPPQQNQQGFQQQMAYGNAQTQNQMAQQQMLMQQQQQQLMRQQMMMQGGYGNQQISNGTGLQQQFGSSAMGMQQNQQQAIQQGYNNGYSVQQQGGPQQQHYGSGGGFF